MPMDYLKTVLFGKRGELQKSPFAPSTTADIPIFYNLLTTLYIYFIERKKSFLTFLG